MPKPTKKTSLLGGWLARFGARKDPPEATGPLRPFQAISIYRGLICCDMARKFSEHRFLVRDAPPLPLSSCSMSEKCQCRYIKHKDRRAEPRRLIDFGVASRLFDGRERRTRGGGRRSKD
ncbi:MAG TPA: hypothetical protein VJS12_08290 [Steroidobacteraceae bacterium]|nr:hypothetical protein [Steroidobacteraceae bacterium]